VFRFAPVIDASCAIVRRSFARSALRTWSDSFGKSASLPYRYLAERAEAVRRERFEGLPPPFELIDFGDELHEVGAQEEFGFPHGRGALIFDIIPNNTQLDPIIHGIS
jgi:hypothetical protein